jgi:hypothetical protein
MFSPGRTVLIDFGLSHHNQLPDLLRKNSACPTERRCTCRPNVCSACGTSAQRSVFVRRAAVLHHGRAAVGERNHARDAPPAMARFISSAQLREDYRLGRRSCAAVSGDRSAWRHPPHRNWHSISPIPAGQNDRAIQRLTATMSTVLRRPSMAT